MDAWSRKLNKYSLCESLYFSQDNRSGKFLNLTRPHKVLPDQSVFGKDKHYNFSSDNRSCVKYDLSYIQIVF